MGQNELASLLLRMNEKTHLGYNAISHDKSSILDVLKPNHNNVVRNPRDPELNKDLQAEIDLFDSMGKVANQ